jgi:Uma2 family endonuclease
VSTGTQSTTADQLFRLPDDGFRYELVHGELRKMTPAGFSHGKVVANLTGSLIAWTKAHDLGVVLGAETGFKIASNPDTVLAPDIAFIRRDRVLELGETEKFWPGAPDLVVEVLSPGDTAYEVEEKVTTWLESGAAVVWVLNPKRRTVHVYRLKSPVQILTEPESLEGEDVLPKFRIQLSEIFA